MGKRDFRWREKKKPKKDAPRTPTANILPPPVIAEVIRKGKKEKEEEPI